MADLDNLEWGEGKVGESGRGWMRAGLGLEPRGGIVKDWELEVGCSRVGVKKANFGESNNGAKRV